MDLPVRYSKLKPLRKREVREEYIRLQGGRCWFCGERLDSKSPYELDRTPIHIERYPRHFFEKPIHLHHDHVTDLTIGAVHAYCNAVSFDYFEQPIGDLPPLMRRPVAEPITSHRLL